MSVFASIRDVGGNLGSQVTAGVATLRRVTPGVALLRMLVAIPLLVASALALPLSTVLSQTFVLFIALAVVAALLPRTHAIGIALVAVGGTWAAVVQDRPLWKVLVMAAALYVAHASATLAAVLPYDCAIAPSALRRWALRTGTVVLLSLGLGAAGLVLTGEIEIPRGIIGPIVGSFVAAAIAGLFAWQLRRRSAAN